MFEQFKQFIKDRQFISNVSPRTVEWYRESLKWLDNPEPTQDELKSLVIRMREAGLKAASCNNRIRALNAYLHWRAEGISKCLSRLETPPYPETQGGAESTSHI